MSQVIDINCDVGEGLHNEADLMPYISSCSIACGGHAGSPEIIKKTIELANQHKVKIGAHPSFADKTNFGRKILDIEPSKLQQSIETQIQLVMEHVIAAGSNLHHVKAHGALYNLSANDIRTAHIVINAVQNTTKDVFLYVPYGSKLLELAQKSGLKVKVEAFADRNYNKDLTLVSRKLSNAVISIKEKVANHLLHMILQKEVIAMDGVGVKMEAQTYCLHGDNINAIDILKYLSKKLPENGIKIA